MKKTTIREKAIKNSSITLICEIAYIIMSFICRTIFIRTLGSEYLGLNSLFSNILTVLSFVDLGLGSALVYKLYRPLNDGNEHLLAIYMNFYKKAYRVIALIVALIGLSLIPFLRYIVDAPEVNIDVRLIYLLFLADTVISYLYVYKKSLLIADQKNYIVEIYTQSINLVMNIAQIIMLVFTKNYVLYLVVKIICDWLNNYLCSKRAEREYRFLRLQTNEGISKEDKIEIKNSVKGLLLNKVSSVIFGGTDDIFISIFEGIRVVGVVSNYTLITVTVNSLLNKVFYSLTSSIGNLAVSSSMDEVENSLKRLYFINTAIYGYVFIGMIVLLQNFVTKIWLDQQYYLSETVVVFLILELVLRGLHYPVYMVRTSLGLFKQLKYIPLICAALNLGLDFSLGSHFGVLGIILSTIIARYISRITDVYVVYHYGFGKSMREYYVVHFKWIVCLGSGAICLFLMCQNIVLVNVSLDFIVKYVIITIVYFTAMILLTRKTDEYLYIKTLIEDKLNKEQRNPL
jgi:O-antigen/teichoic acid export membrane protein